MILENHDITLYNAFKIPARTKYFLSIENEADLPELMAMVSEMKRKSLPILFLGSGTNVLFAFDIFPGLVIRNGIKWIQQEWNFLKVASGELISPLSVNLSKEKSLSIFIPWVGLPGTVGGAVIWNAGCFGLEIKDVLKEIEILNFVSGERKLLSHVELWFWYRSSLLKEKEDIFLLSATFDLGKTLPENEYTKLTPEEMQELRRSKQPPGRTCGSFYKNPPNTSAGKLIDEAGLKWFQIGTVRVSEQHGNFFLADANANWKDILALSEHVKKTIKERFGVDLYEEVRIIYE